MERPTLAEFKECCVEADRLRDVICGKLERRKYEDNGELENKITNSAKKLRKLRKDASLYQSCFDGGIKISEDPTVTIMFPEKEERKNKCRMTNLMKA